MRQGVEGYRGRHKNEEEMKQATLIRVIGIQFILIIRCLITIVISIEAYQNGPHLRLERLPQQHQQR